MKEDDIEMLEEEEDEKFEWFEIQGKMRGNGEFLECVIILYV